MRLLNRPRIVAALLFVGLVISFLWCIVDNILRSTPNTQSADLATVSATAALSAFLWLVGHGVHGAAVVALPVMLWRRARAGNDQTGWEL